MQSRWDWATQTLLLIWGEVTHNYIAFSVLLRRMLGFPPVNVWLACSGLIASYNPPNDIEQGNSSRPLQIWFFLNVLQGLNVWVVLIAQLMVHDSLNLHIFFWKSLDLSYMFSSNILNSSWEKSEMEHLLSFPPRKDFICEMWFCKLKGSSTGVGSRRINGMLLILNTYLIFLDIAKTTIKTQYVVKTMKGCMHLAFCKSIRKLSFFLKDFCMLIFFASSHAYRHRNNLCLFKIHLSFYEHLWNLIQWGWLCAGKLDMRSQIISACHCRF